MSQASNLIIGSHSHSGVSRNPANGRSSKLASNDPRSGQHAFQASPRYEMHEGKKRRCHRQRVPVHRLPTGSGAQNFQGEWFDSFVGLLLYVVSRDRLLFQMLSLVAIRKSAQSQKSPRKTLGSVSSRSCARWRPAWSSSNLAISCLDSAPIWVYHRAFNG